MDTTGRIEWVKTFLLKMSMGSNFAGLDFFFLSYSTSNIYDTWILAGFPKWKFSFLYGL